MAHDETIRIYRSNEPGAEPPSLTYGELAANLADRKVFVGGPGGTADMIVLLETPVSGVTGISAGHTGIAVSGTTGFVRVFNMGVLSIDGLTGHIDLASVVGETGDTVQAGVAIGVTREGNTVTINSLGVTSFNGQTGAVSYSPPLATTGASGVASFLSQDFSVSTTGHVSLLNNYVEINPGDGISVLGEGRVNLGQAVTIRNIGVTAFNGSTGNINLTDFVQGEWIATRSQGNKTIFTNIGVTGISAGHTGIALIGTTGNVRIFNMGVHTFNGSTGHITFNPVTGDTVSAGLAIGVSVVSGNNKRIDNLGVTSFNGATGNVVYAPPVAAAGASGVASFPPTDFGVSTTGVVSLTGNVVRTNVGQTFTAFQNFTSGLSGNLTGSATSLGGTSANLWALQSWVNTNLQSVSQDIQSLQQSKANRTGNNASGTWPINITGNAATATQVLNALTFGSGLVGSANTYNGSSTVTLTNVGVTGISAGHTGIALSGTTGNVQIFNMGILSINGQTGHYTLPAAGATGDTVVAGIGISAIRNGNQVTVNNMGVTSFNGLTGAVGYAPPLATTGASGVASFDSGDFAVSSTGHVTIKALGVGNAQLENSSFRVYTNAGSGLAGGAQVALGGDITLTNIGVTGISAGHTGIALSGTNGNVHIFNMGVHTFNGATGHITFNPATGDTITAGLAIGVSVVSDNNKRIDNLGVTSFNGLTGAVTLTGDGGAIIGAVNNTIGARLATASLTGVASFPIADFGVSTTGEVSLTGNVARTNRSNVFLSTQFFPGTFTALGATFTSLGVNITSGGNLNVASPGKVIAPNITPMAGFDWSLVSTDGSLSPNKGILANKSPSNGKLVLTLNPNDTELAIGSVVRVSGVTGSWEIKAPGGSQIHFGNVSLTPTAGISQYGYLSSTHHRDSVELVCYGVQSLGGLGGTGAFWNVISSVGSIETGIDSELVIVP